MIEQEKMVPVDFESIKVEIFTRAYKEGPIAEIESWRKAFPKLAFEEVDVDLTGQEIDWANRTMQERAFYVAYMNDPQSVEVDYEVEVDSIWLRKSLGDSEKIWSMWINGCFASGELDEKALRSFVWFADESELARLYVADLDLADLKVSRLAVKVAPL
jgi:hypothetical protein